MTRMPSLFLGHGAPTLLDDPVWTRELAEWASALPRPQGILMISAHWEAAPLTLGATATAPLIYDFAGFDRRFYDQEYPVPGAPALARRVREMVAQPVAERPQRGLDHGAYIPLSVMYPQADIPVLQISLPTLEASALFDLGIRLRPLRDEGVLIVGSGFMTHGLPFLDWAGGVNQAPPSWSVEFDQWAARALDHGDIETLLRYRETAPALRYAHPTVEHLAPLFVTMGSATRPHDPVETTITGFWMGLSKRSFAVG